jgi:hypothetical protein
MSVSTAYSVLDYAGNSSTTAFSVTWPFLDDTLVVSQIVNATGVETVKTITTDYTVTGGTDDDGLPATGTVTMVVAPASGVTLRIQRSTPLTQATSWSAFDAFPQTTAEGSFDKTLLIQQELNAATAMGLVDTPFATYWDATGEIIRNVGEPEEDDDAATKGYVDDQVALFDDASIAIGTVTTGAAGASASASLTGTYPAYTLNLTIPRGDAGASGAGTGDVLGPGVSVNNEIMLWNGTTGTSAKRASTTGILKGTSGVLSAAVSGTDYAPATSGSAILKGNGSGGFSSAVSGTDYGAPGKDKFYRHLAGLEPEKLDATTLQIHPGSCANSDGTLLMESSAIIEIDLTTTGANALDTGSITHLTDYHVYILQVDADDSMAAVVSASITYGGVTVPAGHTMWRKLPWGFVYRTDWDGIPNFHLSAWPKPYTRLTSASTASPFTALSIGTDASWTTIDLQNYLPDNARMVEIMTFVDSSGTAGSAYVRSPGVGNSILVGSANPTSPAKTERQTFNIRVNSNRYLDYEVTGGARLTVWVLGYWNTEPS